MKISEIMEKMIAFSKGNIHDINHFMCVWTYAKTIGELENLDQETQYILEVAAITHDIACPFCREKVWQYKRQISGKRRNADCKRISGRYWYVRGTD